VLSAVVVRLSFDDGGPAATERLQPATPTLELEQILDLVRLRLCGVMAERAAAARERDRRTHNGVTGVDVEAVGAPELAHQGELFAERSPRDLDAVARAFARLCAEFGGESVVKAVLRDGHLPEARFEWEGISSLDVPRARAVRHPPLVRRFYPKPVLFSPGLGRDADRQLVAHIDDGSVRETFGPYVVSGGWWSREVHREYYFVRTATGRSLWMYYDRRRQCWFIHGEVE
jgi:protein ImuB